MREGRREGEVREGGRCERGREEGGVGGRGEGRRERLGSEEGYTVRTYIRRVDGKGDKHMHSPVKRPTFGSGHLPSCPEHVCGCSLTSQYS